MASPSGKVAENNKVSHHPNIVEPIVVHIYKLEPDVLLKNAWVLICQVFALRCEETFPALVIIDGVVSWRSKPIDHFSKGLVLDSQVVGGVGVAKGVVLVAPAAEQVACVVVHVLWEHNDNIVSCGPFHETRMSNGSLSVHDRCRL